jgi:histidine triad (HIT) family protein
MSEKTADCVFCRIIRGELPCEMVYEDEKAVAFLDANPARPTHILMVPREHIPTLNDIPPGNDIVAHLARVAVIVAERVGVAEFGYRFLINVNKGGGQEIYHLHAHLLSKKEPELG